MEKTEPTIKKFTFDTEFRGRKVFISDEARQRQRFSLTKAQMEQLKEDGRAEGQHAAEVQAAEANTKAVKELSHVLREQLHATHENLEAIRTEAYEVALAVARKLSGALLDTCPQDAVETTLREAARQAVREPKIILRASAAVIDAMSEEAESITREEGFGGHLELVSDHSMRGADCRIDWEGGGLEQSMKVLEDAIEDILARRTTDSTDAD